MGFKQVNFIIGPEDCYLLLHVGGTNEGKVTQNIRKNTS